MYVRDFNISPRRLPRSRAAILSEAEAALARCLDEQDYDLAGEVLLSWPLTGVWDASSIFGFRVLASVEDKAGFLPAPSLRLNRLRSLAGIERTSYWLATSYHTIYVMGILCAVALQNGKAPPTDLSEPDICPGYTEVLLRYLDDHKPPRHWENEFAGITFSKRDCLARLVLSIALYRKAKAKDFAGLRDLLEVACDLGIADLPTARQATELLERVALTYGMVSHEKNKS